jgi:hypothetical protein
MDRDYLDERLKELFNAKEEREKECKENPLARYSTTELKAELRRRKRR